MAIPQLLMPNLYETGARARERGFQRGQQSRLSELTQQAWDNPQSAQMGAIAAIDPRTAMALEGRQAQQSKSRQEEALNLARAWKSSANATPQEREAFWNNFIAPRAQAAGLPMPAAFDIGTLDREADGLLAMAGGDGQLAPRVVGDSLVDATGKVLYRAPPQQEYAWSDSRGVWIPKPTAQGVPQGAEPYAGQGMPLTSPIGEPDIQNVYAALGNKHGFATTSTTRTPEQNRAANGVPNSQHMSGTARDFSVRGKSPQEVQSFLSDLRGQGFEAFVHDAGSGPHVHAELPPGGRQGGRLAAIPVEGVAPRANQENAPSGYRFNPDMTLAPIPGGPADKQNNPVAADLAKGEMGLRKEVQDRVKQDRSILNMFTNVQNASATPSAAGDLSLIFAYMKMLDPGSVVREQEFANAQNAAGVPDQIRNAYNRAKNGERLNPQQRADFVNQARQLANAAQERITAVTRENQAIADEYGWSPTRATGMADFRGVQSSVQGRASQSTGPQPGIVEDGYRFRGGDPADPNNWERL